MKIKTLVELYKQGKVSIEQNHNAPLEIHLSINKQTVVYKQQQIYDSHELINEMIEKYNPDIKIVGYFGLMSCIIFHYNFVSYENLKSKTIKVLSNQLFHNHYAEHNYNKDYFCVYYFRTNKALKTHIKNDIKMIAGNFYTEVGAQSITVLKNYESSNDPKDYENILKLLYGKWYKTSLAFKESSVKNFFEFFNNLDVCIQYCEEYGELEFFSVLKATYHPNSHYV